MDDSDGDGVYTVTLSLTVPAIEYKFTVDGWIDQEMFDTTYACTKTSGAFTNRLLEMSRILLFQPLVGMSVDLVQTLVFLKN